MQWHDFLELAVWLKVLICAAVLYFGLEAIHRLGLSCFKNVPRHSKKIYHMILLAFAQKTRTWFVGLLSLFIACLIFAQDESWFRISKRVFFVGVMLQLWFWIQHFINLYVAQKTEELSPEDISKATSFRALSFVASVLVLTLQVLFTLDNFGVNISSLVAGLGVGGIAVALAVQNILGDLFSSITIILDKPFRVGDAIAVEDFSGTVESIGIKTTRVRSVSGELVIFSNSDLLKSRIRNYKALYERRVVFSFGVLYETPPEILRKIPEIITKIVKDHPSVRFDRAHFSEFGTTSLEFETVYYVTDSNYNLYMNTQQSINLRIMEELRNLGVDFARPVMTPPSVK